jgi:mono/diheme cytochrome c family protein
MTVVVTGADGTEWTATGNSAGNFWLDPGVVVALPYTARVVDGAGNERVMLTALDNGDCASCHTAGGSNAAPGRVLAPTTP